MPKLPPGLISAQASPIAAALSEGRTEDARRMLVELLLEGKADRSSQKLAAQMLRPQRKGRGRPKTLPAHWYDIATCFHDLRDGGRSYEDALRTTAERFGYGETHVRKCVADYDDAKAEHDERANEAYEEWLAQHRTK